MSYTLLHNIKRCRPALMLHSTADCQGARTYDRCWWDSTSTAQHSLTTISLHPPQQRCCYRFAALWSTACAAWRVPACPLVSQALQVHLLLLSQQLVYPGLVVAGIQHSRVLMQELLSCTQGQTLCIYQMLQHGLQLCLNIHLHCSRMCGYTQQLREGGVTEQ